MVRLFRQGSMYHVRGVYREKRFQVNTRYSDITAAMRYKEVLAALLDEADHLGIVVDPCGKLDRISDIVARAWQRSPYKTE